MPNDVRHDRPPADERIIRVPEPPHTALEDLLAVIAHELRAPLTVVHTAAATIAAGHLSPEQLDPLLQVIRRNAERIFDKYTQADRTASGVGLGLYISRGLARANGGDLTVATPPGGGSLFTLRLAATPTPATPSTG